MDKKEQRIAISEVCGWKRVRGDWENDHFHCGSHNCSHTYHFKWIPPEGGYASTCHENDVLVPDYLNDLNAMREAIRTLDDEQMLEFMLNLCDVLVIFPDLSKWTILSKALIATPEQLAEAFLRTLNLWTA